MKKAKHPNSYSSELSLVISDPKSIFMGRDQSALFGDRYCSKRHALLYRCPLRGMRVIDLGSTNGTFVNGKRVTESPLKSGDQIRIGRTVFTIEVNCENSSEQLFDAGECEGDPLELEDPPQIEIRQNR